ncbi:MAG: phosphoenolpyruvate synthase [Eubacteriales bacterium]|nr:phosphoenolpyruvate synthase [Eubacteriales bacterium]MDZ7610746.1 phosphoenolpyruvate synthase [Eubacteriales bacterium]
METYAELTTDCIGVEGDRTVPLTVGFEEIRVGDVALAGGKGANLGELMGIPGIVVPPGFIVTTAAYRTFLRSDRRLTERIRALLQGLDPSDSEYVTRLAVAGQGIRDLIDRSGIVIPEQIVREITRKYRALAADAGNPELPVAVRSSASAEDLPDASFAGQQDTYLNVRGEDAVIAAVRRCWASLFTDRAISYRIEKGFDHLQVEIAVVVQRMIRSRKSGTAFSVDIETGWNARHGTTRGVVYLDVGEGLGEGIVSGIQTPDNYLLAVAPDGQIVILEKRLGAKEEMVVYDEAAGGTTTVPVPETLQQSFAVTDVQAKEIAAVVLTVSEHYGDLRDIEFAIDEENQVWITQARPETVFVGEEPGVIKQKKKVVRHDMLEQAELLCSGTPGLGAACGRLVLIDARDPQALSAQMSRVGPGDILCAEFTTPDMVPAMQVAGGFITAVGGSTSHAAIVARELRKPAVVGVGKPALDTLRQILAESPEVTVTVDGEAGRVYRHPYSLDDFLVETGESIHIDQLPVTKTKIGLIMASPFVARRFPIAAYPSHYGVSLLRAEFVLARMEIHPQALFAFDYGEFADGGRFADLYQLRDKITEVIRGYHSGRQFYVETLGQAIASIAATQSPDQPVIYRTTDFKSNEYHEMWGGYLFEQREANPMLGFRGEGRMIDPSYAAVFRWELEAIKLAREMGYRNVAVMFPVVRTSAELGKALDFLSAEGLRRGEEELRIGMMVEVPYNALDLESFLTDQAGQARLDFISIGSNDLTQFVLAVGRDNDRMHAVFDETDPAVVQALETVIKTARKLGVKTGLCGQRPSNDPAFAELLVRMGIDSIGVADTSYVAVVRAVAEAEARLTVVGAPDPAPDVLSTPPGAEGSEAVIRKLPCSRIRAEEILQQIGCHPLDLKAEHHDPETYYTGAFREALTIACISRLPGTIPVFSTNDLDAPGFSRLRGGMRLESPDENPLMGFSGLSRWTDPAYEEFLRWELRALRNVIAHGIPLRVELTQVRTLKELDRALAILAEEGLGGIAVGMEIAIPANVLLLERYLRRGLDFVSVHEPKLAQYVLAADLKSSRMLVAPDEVRAVLDRIGRVVYRKTNECGVTVLSGVKYETKGFSKSIGNARLAYPYRVPYLQKQCFRGWPTVRAEIRIREGGTRLTVLKGELSTSQLRALGVLMSYTAPSVIRDYPRCGQGYRFSLVVTPDLEWVAEADIDAGSVLIHPSFFTLSEVEQLTVFYHELVSHTLHGERNEERALCDTAAHIIDQVAGDGRHQTMLHGLVRILLNRVYRQIYGKNITVRVENVDVRELRPTHDLHYHIPETRDKICMLRDDRVPVLLVWDQGAKYILDGHGRAAVAYRTGHYHLDAIVIRPTGVVENNPVESLRYELDTFLKGIKTVAELKVDMPPEKDLRCPPFQTSNRLRSHRKVGHPA